jgi:hypothetical protein
MAFNIARPITHEHNEMRMDFIAHVTSTAAYFWRNQIVGASAKI